MPAACGPGHNRRNDWLAARSVPVEIEGLESCLPMFGLG
jgi:hypothetical protein